MARPSGTQFSFLVLIDRVGINADGRKFILTEMSRLFRGVMSEWREMNPNAQFLLFLPQFGDSSFLKDTDLRCFILPSQSRSVVSRFSAGALGGGGTTFQTRNGTISEVYDSVFDDYTSECAVIFHELMHNKLQMGDEMHTDGSVGFGIASAEVETATTSLGRRSLGMNGTNQRAMAKTLLNSVPQFLGN
jgi:hypothetical protein